MKKYIFRYIFIVILIIILLLLTDVQPKIYIGEFNDYLQTGNTEGLYGTYYLFLANTCFAIIISIAVVATTISKQNKVKFKYLIASAILLSLFFLLPFMSHLTIDTVNSGFKEEHFSIFSYIMHIFG